MATPKIIADFETQLSTAIAIGDTTFSLKSATDDDGVALPTGLYYFTIDNGSSQKEYLAGTLTGTSVASVVSVSRQGSETSGATRKHRVGASVILTDFATYKKYMDEISLVSAPDASTTTKGVVEIATLAQVRAGTGVGETGAILVVSPTELDDMPTEDEKAALAGYPSAPSSTNKFLTRGKSVTAGASIDGASTPVPVYQNKTDNEFYACDANDTSAMKFLGFAISSGTDGNAMIVQFNGIVSGFTGLSEGEKYYLQDTAGTIGTTPGTYEVLVGVAISETQLLIQKGTRRAAAEAGDVGLSGSSLAVTCGFRPSRIRVTVRTTHDTASHALLDFVWINGTISAISLFQEDNADNRVDHEPRVYYSNSSTYMEFSIGSVTDTGFTISWTENGSFGPDYAKFMWEAEGEL
jgi:hypothetical protein